MHLGETQKKEIISILYLGLALLIFFSLFSYSSSDPSLNHQAVQGAEINNFIGLFGSYLSDLLYQVIGWSAYLIPFLLLIEAIQVLGDLSEKPIKTRILGVFLLGFSVMVICALAIKNPADTEFLPGGVIGQAVSEQLLRFLRRGGTYIVITITFCLSLILSTQFLFTHFLTGIGRLVKVIVTYPRRWQINSGKTKTSKPKRNLIERTAPPAELPFEDSPKAVSAKVNDLPLFKSSQNQARPNDQYLLPPLNLMKPPPRQDNGKRYLEEIQATAERLESVLHDFGVKAEVVGFSRGPVITRYELEPASGVKVSRIVSLADDLALRLEAKTIRIIAPIPGKAAVGIELPNEHVRMVTLSELLGHHSYKRDREKGKLLLGLGKTISGENYWADLEKMPHLLVAGATGAGKSVCINTIITNILYNATPDEVKFILIDPKRVELNIFEDLPHLLVPVVVEVEEASTALKWVVREMEFRYQNFARLGTRNIQAYNNSDPARKRDLDLDEKLPYIVVIVDEFADLMMLAGKEVETSITRLAQMARAVGIHLILATQRPSVDVITGLIKANFPARIAFKVASKIDSRTILDANGAEQLLGEGDMLYSRSGALKPVRLQGPYISRDELIEVTDFIKEQQAPDYAMDILEPVKESVEDNPGQERDALYDEAVRIVIEEQVASSSRLQRRLRIGYNRAARLIEDMEADAIVGPLQSNNTRSVIKGRDYLMQINR